MQNKTLNICYTAILTALNVVVCIVTNNVYASQIISFVYFFTFVAGIYLGWISGACVGFLGYIISFLLAAHDLFNPFLWVSDTLLGIVAALCYRIPKWKPLPKIALAYGLCAFFLTSILNTTGQWLIASGIPDTFWGYFARLPWQLLWECVNVAAVFALVRSGVLDKLILQSRSLFEQNRLSGDDLMSDAIETKDEKENDDKETKTEDDK